MNKPDPFEQIRTADPLLHGDTSELKPHKSFDAHLKEITMNVIEAPKTTQPKLQVKVPRWNWATVPVAAAMFAVAVAAITLVSTVATPSSAYAQVARAASATANHESGLVTIHFGLREGSEPVTDEVSTFRFDGDDYEVVNIEEGQTFTRIMVDGNFYSPAITSDGEPEGFIVTKGPAPEDGVQFSSTDLDVILDSGPASAELILPLIETSPDFEEISSRSGETVFRGSIDSAQLSNFDPSELPIGLSFFAGEEMAEEGLPESFMVEVTVVDKTLRTVVLTIKDESANGAIEATITTDYSELGEPQTITTPPSDQVKTPEQQQEDLDPEVQEALAVMTETHQRRPELCSTHPSVTILEQGFAVDDKAASAAFDEAYEALAQCYEDNGEPKAAAAFRFLGS